MVSDQTKTTPQRSTRRSLGYTLPYILAVIITLVVIGQLGALAQTPRTPDIAMLAATGTVVHPTRTSSPTSTALPTPTATHTPTYTPMPSPTSPPPPTNTPSPVVTLTYTPLPGPTKTMVPTSMPLPPTKTPVPVTILEQIEVDNGTFGKQQVFVRYESDTSGDQFYVTGTDGYRYRVTMGFLSSPEALAKTQEFWTYGGRGSANWGMIILVRKQIADWYNCPATTSVCYNTRTDSGQAVLFTDLFLRDAVWKSLLNDYLTGGILKTTTNTYYYQIQKSIFDPICHQTPAIPCIGFIFTRSG